jgi:hypothetical protein
MPIAFTGSMWITGSLYINGVQANPVSRSYAVTASHNSNAISSASNGLIKTGSSVELGGYVYKNTYITGALDATQLIFKKVKVNYASDYSQFFISRSIVDKGYLDNLLSGSVRTTGSVYQTGSSSAFYITLPVIDQLPTLNVPTGSVLSSGSGVDNKPYYWNGATWTSLL